ncbi:hypothetical protein A2532_00620 [Candidatus Wolfebacteria bacterium RIFOXYD2_FULL_48_11]|nr:MAG: hypothetical protein A2532_00620 [Candidatus Wolfebacteria bacterium RIFOXYD2_FULL_48_11]
MKKAEESMTEEQKGMTDERTFDRWKPKGEFIKETYKEDKTGRASSLGGRVEDYEALDIKELEVPLYPLHGDRMRIKILPDGRTLENRGDLIKYGSKSDASELRELVSRDLESKKAEYERLGKDIQLLEKAKEALDKKTA